MEKIIPIDKKEDILKYLEHLKKIIEEDKLIGFCSFVSLKGNDIEMFTSQYFYNHPEKLYMALDDIKDELRVPDICDISIYGEYDDLD